jgi:hypothetical protein
MKTMKNNLSNKLIQVVLIYVQVAQKRVNRVLKSKKTTVKILQRKNKIAQVLQKKDKIT